MSYDPTCSLDDAHALQEKFRSTPRSFYWRDYGLESAAKVIAYAIVGNRYLYDSEMEYAQKLLSYLSD